MNEDRASHYHRLKRRAGVLSGLLAFTLLAGFTASGLSASLRDDAWALANPLTPSLDVRLGAAVVFYVLVVWVVSEVLSLPLGIYRGYWLERRFELNHESLGGWFRDRMKSALVGAGLGCTAAVLVSVLASHFPGLWWVLASALFALLLLALTNLAPVALLPIFYRFKPLERQELRARLLALAERTGTRVVDAFEWELGDKTRRANAALTGLGRTRRILISDTLLETFSDEEIEVILAHELAHHVHHDIWKGLALETATLAAGFWVSAHVLTSPLVTGWTGVTGPADIAGLPIVLLTFTTLSFVLGPLVNALSRAHERRADTFALRLTRNAGAFVTAIRRLGSQNLAEERPSRWAVWLFHTHPSVHERVAAARRWAEEGEQGR